MNRQTIPPTSPLRRLLNSTWRQRQRTVRCPPGPRLDGKIALVTGGSAGIGLATSKGLAARGARVVIAARNEDKAAGAARQIHRQSGHEPWVLRLDLADLAAVRDAVGELSTRLGGQKIDILVANAGVCPERYGQSAQGHEVAFATNVLGHFALAQQLFTHELLAAARVVVLTGDIYFLASDCTRDFQYRGRLGGLLAYCRSKLGNLWFSQQLQQRYSHLAVCAVHPGAVATRMTSIGPQLVDGIHRSLLLTAELGAQCSLWCATQPDLQPGAYYHNTMGRMDLRDDDPARNRRRARELWSLCESLNAGFCP